MKKNLLFLILSIFTFTLLWGCKDDNVTPPEPPKPEPIEIAGTYKGNVKISIPELGVDTTFVQKVYFTSNGENRVNFRMNNLRLPDDQGVFENIEFIAVNSVELVSESETNSLVTVKSTKGQGTYGDPLGKADITVSGTVTDKSKMKLTVSFEQVGTREATLANLGSGIVFEGTLMQTDNEKTNAELISFVFEDNDMVATDPVINSARKRISFSLSQDITDEQLAAMVPTIEVSEGATVTPASGTPVNFTDGTATFTIVAEDGIKAEVYTAMFTYAPSAKSRILEFYFEGEDYIYEDPDGGPQTTIDGDQITFKIKYGTDVSQLRGLRPTIVISEGATVNPASGTGVDFSSGSARFTVTAEDEETKGVYTASWTYGPSNEALVERIEFEQIDGRNAIVSSQPERVGETNEFLFYVQYGATENELANLLPTVYASEKATFSPDNLNNGSQASSAISFTDREFTFTVIAEDGIAKNDYTLRYEVGANTDATLYTLEFPYDDFVYEQPTIIEGTTNIEFKVDYGTDIEKLKIMIPSMTQSEGATTEPVSGAAADFSANPTTITVTAENGASTEYSVRWGYGPSNEAELISLVVEDSPYLEQNVTANYDGRGYFFRMYGTEDQDPYKFTPVLKVSPGATVSPASGTKLDFSDGQTVTFVITAENGIDTTQVTLRPVISSTKVIVYDFEDWTYGNYDVPQTGWDTSNTGVKAIIDLKSNALLGGVGYTGPYAIVKSEDSYTGQYSAQLNTLNTIGSHTVPKITSGSLFIGRFETKITDKLASTRFGMAYNDGKKPKKVTGYYKYTPGTEYHKNRDGIDPNAQDKMVVTTVFYKVAAEDPNNDKYYLTGKNLTTSSDIVAMDQYTSGETVTEWRKFELNLDVNDLDPDQHYKLTIVFSSSDQGVKYYGAIDSKLLVDCVSIIYEQ